LLDKNPLLSFCASLFIIFPDVLEFVAVVLEFVAVVLEFKGGVL
jgi:hypothetical protein